MKKKKMTLFIKYSKHKRYIHVSDLNQGYLKDKPIKQTFTDKILGIIGQSSVN